MKARKMLTTTGLLLAASTSISGATPGIDIGTRPSPNGDSSSTPGHANATAGYLAGTSNEPDVINLVGLRGGVAFGDSERELSRRGLLDAESPCAPALAGLPSVSPVFDRDRLVLLWADSPVHTPEGVTIGTPVEQVEARYPAATRLTAPPGTYRFDGLLARDGDRAYLFLHDGHTVRKTIVGYTDYVRRLFDDGFGTC